MSKILRRPMFRGGSVSSYGNGIASGLADGGMPSKRGFVDGPGGYAGDDIKTGGELLFGTKAYTPEMYTDFMKRMFTNTGNKKTNVPGMFQPDAEKFYNPDGYVEEDFEYEKLFKPDESIFTNELFQRADAGIPGALKDRVMSGGKNEFATALKKDILKNLPKYDIGGKGGGDDLGDELSTAEKLAIAKENEERATIREEGRFNPESQAALKKLLDKQKDDEVRLNIKEQAAMDQYPDAGVNTVPKNEIEVKESFEDDGTEMGYQQIADEYYKTLSAGADERLQARIDAAEAKADKKISRARKTDAFNTMLKFFEGSQQEGATVGSAAAEASKYLTSKPSATELAMDKKDSRLEQIEDAGFNREEATRVQAGAFAFKDLMQEKGFDFKKELQKSGFDFTNVKSEKDFNNQMKLLTEKLDAQKDIANKNLILSLKKMDTAGQYEKKVDQIIQDRFGGDESKRAEASRIALGDAGTIEIAVYDATQGGMPITDKAFDLLATEYTDGPMPEGDLAGVSGVFYIPGEMQIVTVVEGVVDKSKTKNFKP